MTRYGKPDEKFMRRTLEMARENIDAGGGPFAALLVKDGEVIAGAGNRVTSMHDPTAHAEILVIREAAQKLETHDLSGCELYASCEPCPMCLGAIYWAHVSAVYFGAGRTDAEKAGFDDHMIYRELNKEPQQRSVPMKQLPSDEAREVFTKWVRTPGKEPY